MGIKVLDPPPFKDVDLIQAGTQYSQSYNMEDWSYCGSVNEAGAHGWHDSTGTGTVSITVEGSFDAANWVNIGTILASIASDGNTDFGVLDLAGPYPFIRFLATEDNVGTCVDLNVQVSIPVDGKP